MYKFIIIDDEPLIRKGILKKIEALNLNLELVGEAENGEEALELINKVNPQIVLTDMRMPLMDGKMLLRKLYQDFPHIKAIVISGYSDFEYLHQAISSQATDYILKPFNREEIGKALKKAIDSFEKDLSTQKKIESIEAENEQVSYNTDLKYLSELILTQQATYDSGYLKSKKTNFIKACNSYVLVSVYSPQESSESTYSNIQDYLKKTNNVLIIPGHGKQSIYFLLYAFKEVTKSQSSMLIENEIKGISSYLNSIDKTEFYISVSSVITALNDLHIAYLESISNLDKRDLHYKNTMYFYNGSSIPPLELNWNSIEKLVFFIEAGNLEKVKELLKEFFSELEQLSPLTMISVKFNCQLIFNRVTDMLQEYYDLFNDYSFTSKYERLMNNVFDLGLIENGFHRLLLDIASLLKEKNIYPSNEIIDNVKKYILKNYTQDITLEKISELFFINPSYFSYLFKEKTCENFSDYINEVRINKAKDLLTNTNYRVYKIGKMLGYDNDKYFFRIFKKMTGYTPEGFRQHSNKNKTNSSG